MAISRERESVCACVSARTCAITCELTAAQCSQLKSLCWFGEGGYYFL